jgi:arginyl-tRNA synthetase
VALLNTSLYDKCPVLKAERPEQVESRLFRCNTKARTLHWGMALLGIRTPQRL